MRLSDYQRLLILCLLLVSGLVAIYQSSLSFGWLEIEDGDYYLRNPLFGPAPFLDRFASAFLSAPQNNWIPGTWGFGIFVEHFFGLSASAFRALSLVIHCSNALLVLFLALRLTNQQVIAFTTAVIFACHPVQVESVIWISSLKGLLSVFFTLISLHLLVGNSSKVSYSLGFLLYALALLCKQDVIAFPIVLFLLWQKDGRSKCWSKLLPFFGVAILAAVMALLVNQGNLNPATPPHLLDLIARPFMALGHYFTKWLVPLSLYPEYRLPAQNMALLSLGVLIVVWAAVLVLRHFQKGAEKTQISTAFVLAVLTLFPFLGWTPGPLEFASDRISYFPSVFASLAFACLLGCIFKSAYWVFSPVLAGLLLSLTWAQVPVWKSDRMLCEHTLKIEPDHYLTRINLALLFAREKDFEKAKSHLLQVVHAHPQRARAWTELAKVYMVTGEQENAHEAVQKGLEVSPEDPQLRKILNDLN